MVCQLFHHLFSHNLLTSHQFGFLEGFSTQDLLLSLSNHWLDAIDKSVGVVLLDLKKAFDHGILIGKLNYYNLYCSVISWMKSYLHDRQQRDKIDCKLSSWKSIQMGVPQGSILGPILFCLYINDLPSVIEHNLIRLYADNTSLTAVADST